MCNINQPESLKIADMIERDVRNLHNMLLHNMTPECPIPIYDDPTLNQCLLAHYKQKNSRVKRNYNVPLVVQCA